MEDILSTLYDLYATPIIENDKILGSFSAGLQDLDDSQKKLYIQTQELVGRKAFLLGLRTGAALEQFLNRDENVI